MDTYLAKRAKLPVDEWATEVWAAAYEAGVVNGTAPKGLVTRQEVIAMIAKIHIRRRRCPSRAIVFSIIKEHFFVQKPFRKMRPKIKI